MTAALSLPVVLSMKDTVVPRSGWFCLLFLVEGMGNSSTHINSRSYLSRWATDMLSRPPWLAFIAQIRIVATRATAVGGGEIQNDEICLSPLSEQLVSVLCSQTSSNSVTGFKGHVISRAKNGHGHDPKLDSSSIEHGRVVLPRWSRALGGANQDRAYDPTPDSFRSQCRGRKEGETKDVRQSQAK